MDFSFNASALAAGATIERGAVLTTTTSLGSVVLTPSGGEGRSVVTDYFSDELQIAHAETKVSGRGFVQRQRGGREEQRFASYTSILMKGVSIFDRVKIREMGTIISSTRGFENDDDHDFDIRIWFEGVRIADEDVVVSIDEPLRRLSRYDHVHRFVADNGTAETHAKQFGGAGKDLMESFLKRRLVRLFLVRDVKGPKRSDLAAVPVDGLGIVHFGELILKPGLRRVNLVRVAFDGRERGLHENNETLDVSQLQAAEPRLMGDGSSGSLKGSMILGSGEGNGTPIGP